MSGSIWHGGYCPAGICPGGICPGGICPDTENRHYNYHGITWVPLTFCVNHLNAFFPSTIQIA